MVLKSDHTCCRTKSEVWSPNSSLRLEWVPSVHVFVFLQWSGDYHGGQFTLYPAAALHCWCAPVAPHHWCHRCRRLWWEWPPPPPTASGPLYISLRCHSCFFYSHQLFTPVPSGQPEPDTDLSHLIASVSRLPFSLRVFQVSGTVAGSTELWAANQALTSPSLISASTPISAYTCSSAKLGSSLVSLVLAANMTLLHTSMFKC